MQEQLSWVDLASQPRPFHSTLPPSDPSFPGGPTPSAVSTMQALVLLGRSEQSCAVLCEDGLGVTVSVFFSSQ
ncbi:hypothetical protein J1605_021431 [Eschrichtius robustus]|uniref:Uncharacterized protein n=1 Tax=Eschrichtius robustus TaxID=9764 RepID=A0AB34HIG2_ESCRO|nr:hypothetical protein J1605_021431 [Eschrichtius robustus]